jgi:hypothetical protein
MSRYKFITGCPVCGSKEICKWVHKDCSSYEEIDENGDIYCSGCNKLLGFIMDLEYRCGHHDSQKPTNAFNVIQALALLTVAEDIPPIIVKEISEKILERANR